MVTGIVKVMGAGADMCPRREKGNCYTHLRARVRDMGMLKVIGVAILTSNSVFLNSVGRPVAKAGSKRGTLGSNLPFASHPGTIHCSCGIRVSKRPGHVHRAKFDGGAAIPKRSYTVVIYLLRGHSRSTRKGVVTGQMNAMTMGCGHSRS